MLKSVLITGANGFIGANLANKLAKNSHVHIIIRKDSDLWRLKSINKPLDIHYADLADAEAIDSILGDIRPEIVFHLAAYGTHSSQNDLKKILLSDVIGTNNLLTACTRRKPRIFINIGSSSEYGRKNAPMRETDLPEPNTGYGLAKTAQTLLAQNFSREKKLSVITLRLFSVYGPYESPAKLIPRLIQSCLAGQELKLTSPDSSHDFIYAGDVVRACLAAAEKPELNGEVINIGSGRQTSLKEIVDLVKSLTKSAAKENWGAFPDPPYDSKIWVADISKARNLLDWRPEHNLEEGLAETIEWFKDNQKIIKEKYVI
jgi:nucleoside-diphosphate-sugar epimerase